MIYQVTTGLSAQLAETGCFFLSILRIAEKILNIEFAVKQVNQLFEKCLTIGYIGDEADIKVKATRGIAQIISAIMEETIYMKRTTKGGNYNFLIGHYRRLKNGKYLHHFVLMEADGITVAYDPWSAEGSRTVREGSLFDYRFLFAEEV